MSTYLDWQQQRIPHPRGRAVCLESAIMIARSHKRQNRAGLSLLETVVSGFILTLVVIFVTSLFPSSLIAIQSSESRVEADYLASNLLEEIRHQPFEHIVSLPPTDVTAGRHRLSYRTEVADVDDSDPRFIKQVRVIVTWTERGREKELVRESWIHALRR